MDATAVDLDPITDEELAALALAADPDVPLDDDARPFGSVDEQAGLLPGWYMPAATRRGLGRRRRIVIACIIGALLLVNGAGLCVTSGFPEIAW